MLFLASPPRTAFFVLLFFPEAYKAVGRALEWDVLGVAEDETAMAQYREEVGTLADRRWEALTFLMPEKEVSLFGMFLGNVDMGPIPHLSWSGERTMLSRPIFVGGLSTPPWRTGRSRPVCSVDLLPVSASS